MATSKVSDNLCHKCSSSNLKVFDDDSGFCLDCEYTFADITTLDSFIPPQTTSLSSAPRKKDRTNSLKMKITATFVVVIVLVGIMGYGFLNKTFNPKIHIDQKDEEFFEEYPGLYANPTMYHGDTLWGEYNPYINYFSLQLVQITPTIENIAQQFNDEYPDDVYERINATFKFIASSVELGDIGDFYQFPINVLLSGEGNCAESSALLASLLYAEGFTEVAIVVTNGTELPHSYVAVRLPMATEADNPVENKIKGYLDENWIAMDPTNDNYGNHLKFRELYSSFDFHNNVVTIVKVPIFGCILDFFYDWDYDDPELGTFMRVDCGLMAIEHDITFSFEFLQNGEPYSSYTINVPYQGKYIVEECSFILDIEDSFWENRTDGQWCFGIQIDYQIT